MEENKIKKVYVVIEDDVYDFESKTTCEVFAEYNDALNFVNDRLKVIKEDIDEDMIIDEGIGYYSAYEDGRYSENHYCIYISEKVVQ